MKTKLTILLSASALLLGVGLAAAGPHGPGPGGPGGFGGPPPEVLKEFDKNNDGQLDDAERKAAHEAMKARHEAQHQQMLAKYDANRDGKLDDTERAKLHDELATEHFRKADKNGDGVLTLDEFKAGVRERHLEMRKGGKQGRRAQRMLQRGTR